MELLIGAGNRRVKMLSQEGKREWQRLVTLDLSPACKPDVVYDLEGCQLPFKDSSFDEIHAYEVLEHVGSQGDWKFFLRQMDDFARVLRPDGMLYISSPAVDSKWLWGDPGHRRYFGPETVTFVCKSAYEQLGQTSMTDYRPYFRHFWNLEYYSKTQDGSNMMALRSLKEAKDDVRNNVQA